MDDFTEKVIAERVKKYGTSSLFHYTSLDALINILRTKQLWFGYTKNMNDSSELICFKNAMKEELLKVLSSSEKTTEIINKLDKVVDESHTYIMSLSTLCEDASQWERYGDNAHGICICFNTEKLIRLSYVSSFWMNPVFYEWEATNHELFQTICKYANSGELSGFSNLDHIIENLSYCSMFHKHKAFASEKEIRLIELFHEALNPQNFIFSKKNNTIKKFYIEDIDVLCKKAEISFDDLIDKIIIGPRSNQGIEELQDYLKTINYESLVNKVVKSNCPLR